MANTSVFLLFLLFLVATQANALRGIVGGRTEVKNVKNNKEVQDLGKYCVEQYNSKQKHSANGRKLLTFSQVVEAEKQVVSGIKYYLKISTAVYGSGIPKNFDAVVVVKPWVNSKELLNFAPSTPSPTK
ncbi:cysteine proteinase inhibitor B-like [Olea europaea var. sylvestris]|uniref:cysteine proteinase inhibitor B-like n=1 Tax=Olea europaea var. sylvestris TaxID=158386 RepID=UPI000C1D401D|nr:cysteine proteinase inhibitor B-like [Olea europaea var. sylvestris]